MTSGSWQLSIGLKLSGQNLLLGNARPVKANPTSQISQVMGFGTASDQINQIALQQRTLGAGLSENLDLYDGSTNSPQLLDITNVAVGFRNLKGFAFWIVAGGDSTGVTVGAAASNPNTLWWNGTTPSQTVHDDAPISGGSNAGVTVSTSARYIKVLNNGAVAVTYLVALAGVTTAGSGFAMGVLGLTYP